MTRQWLTIQENCTDRVNEGLKILASVDFRPIVKRFALYSGGNDSICSTHLAMNNGWADEVIHIDTGIGVRQTHAHAIEVCERMGWPYRVLTPPNWTYEDMVLRRGFPGPAAHRYAYSWLKERPIAKLVRETKTHRMDKVILITGVRNRESARRMGYTKPVVKMGARIWVAPLFTFSKADCQQYIAYYGLPRNPVSDELGYSAECVCGSFAKDGELSIINRIDPETGMQIALLQQKAKLAGKHCVWGTRPPKERKTDDAFMPMCVGCLSDHVAQPAGKGDTKP